MRWVFLIVALFACATICWSKGKNSPGSVGRNKNYPDRDEVEECGRIQIQIRRNTGPFRRLINHPSRSDRLRSDSADHFYVSNRLKLIIDRLIVLIASDDVIYIVSGWRSVVIISERLSLSYEGRSIRFRYGSNNGASRLRALAGLAIEAGCDWIRNDDDENITCSVKPDDCRVPTDLTFMLDTSGSVGRKNHKEALKFISNVISYFNIGPNATQVSFIPFSTYVHSYFFLNSFSDKTNLLRQVLSTGYYGGWTRTWKALYIAQRYVYNTTVGLGARPISSGVPRVAIILTDGQSNGRNAIPYANRLKEQGVIVFSIGIGRSIDSDELNEFASDPDDDHVFFIDSYPDIEDFVNRLSTYTCQEPGVTEPGNETEVELPEDDFRYFQGMCSSYNHSNTTITIEETDVEGSCSVYVSTDPNNRNPGPLTNVLTTYSNTSETVIKHITLPSGINTTLIYISLRGTGTMNRCTVTIYDSLFNQTEYSFSLPEDVYNNRALGTLLAEFRSGGFEYRYSIIPERDYNFFDIDSYSGALTVSGTFDREERSTYRASVLVEDPRISCLKGRTNVILVISDVNDNSPTFLMQSYTVNVLETDAIDSMILTVSAVDQDLGLNANVTYSFGNSPVPSSDFAITSDGVVSVSGSLDGFITPSYEYTVVAIDGGQTPMTGTATLSITVEQVNFPPIFTGPVCLSGMCELSLAEDTALGGVLNLSATDPDTGGPDAQLAYSGGSSPFEVDVGTGELRLTSTLDRETVPSYTLDYFVSDGGTPSLSDTVRVFVTVTDVNDNPPVFDPDSYSSVLPENIGITAIFEVRATDIDDGPNGEIFYSLDGLYSQYFSVDPNGVVSTLAAFDFENIPSNPLEFSITASNLNGVFLVYATGSLEITDLNDNSPVISGDITASLPEDVSTDTVVFNLTVSDADSGSNGEVTVELVEGNQNGQFALTYTDTFAIIRLRLSLDFETSRSHALKLRATDGGDPARITSLDLTLSVGDINDNTPVCIAGVSNTLQEDVAIGTQVGQVTASDGDRPNTPNSEISYSITAVNNTQNYLFLFSVDTAGVVTTNDTLDIELSPQYIISVTASDNGNPVRTCLSLVTLTLQDVNEFPPVINTTASALNVSAREDTPVDTVIAVVTAIDPDFTAGQITYVLNSPDFSIDADNGEVSVSAPLDFEMIPSYQLTVIADDGQNEQTAILSVMIININDVTPSLDIDSPVEVSEAAPAGSLVSCFIIIDSDGDANGEFSVGISGSGAALLTYNTTTSCIHLAQPLDREGDLGDNIQVLLTVNDNGDPNLHSTTEVLLVILDANDNSPLFPSGPFTASVPENTAIGTPVRSVPASDRDAGLNSQIIYSIDSTQFAIDSTTSEITVNGTIDFESTPLIQVEVTARDLGSPSLSASAIVIVSVTDTNDNVPRITNLPDTVRLAENGEINHTVFEVTSSDLDTDYNSVNRRYSLSVSPNNIPNFSINPVSGLITADANLFNREGVPDYTLTISVSDGSNSDSDILNVVITDVNDNPPIFIGDLSFSIKECELNCDNTFQVGTTDNDQAGTNNTHIMSVIVFNTNSFTASLLSTNTISISCNPNTLDFEMSATESFILQATDGGSPQLSTNATILVNVIDCNDNPPIISPAVIEVSLLEDTLVETVVANFNATDMDTGLSGVITYRQIEAGINFFTIDASTGEVTLIRALDFETNTIHYFNITASDSGSPSFSSEGSLIVTVVNTNDNLPVFNPAHYTIYLPEDTPVGYMYSEIQATDADGDSIELSVGEGAPFMTNANTFNLTLDTNLDFETQRTYFFYVNASNPGSAESVSAAVTLNVLDVNDNSPNFTNSINTFNISEDIQVGIFVFAATAQDPDSGANGMFSFFFDSDFDEFNISSSGSVTTAGNLDREFLSSYILTITVRDMGNPARSSTMDFTVQITDVNDNIPVFGLTSYSDYIAEDAIPGTLLSRVIIATDADFGVNGEVDLTDNSAEFEVLSNGSVSLVTDLDFELRTSYTFTIIATDRGTPSLSNTTSFTVHLLNVNDNGPVFSPNAFEQTLEECNQLTHSCLCERVIFTALATDADNDMLTYSSQVISGSAVIFTVNPTTGELTASCEVDREVNDLFEIEITASDGEFTADAILSLHITDVNDNIPYFPSPDMIMQVGEDAQLSTEIATVDVIDRDIGLNGAVELSIQLLYPLNIPSVVSIAQDGRISLSRALDFESVTEYQFLINATDRGAPTLHNTTTFTLQVTDFNDNPPIFDTSNYSISIDENSPLGAILCVSASDADSGANSQLTFFVPNSTQVEDALESAFDFVGCNLTTLNNFDFEVIQHFTIFIGARDAGSPSLSAIIPVFIQIIDLNDNMPMFEGDYPDPLPVSESTPVGTTILTVRAIDIDSGANGEVAFSLQGAQGNFDITAGGFLRTLAELDFESIVVYSFYVIATDSGSTPLSSSLTITVQVVNENDNTPVFNQSSYSFYISEGSSLSTFVGFTPATDADSGVFGNLTYSIASGPSNILNYTVGTSSGLFTAGALDRETVSTYSLTVRVQDGGSPLLFDTATISITVLDVNDNAPMFGNDTLEVPINENVPLGTLVTELIATDADEPNTRNSLISFSTNDTRFRLETDSTNGVVMLLTNSSIDRETQDIYIILITATDNGDTPLSSSAFVTVVVLDIDDNAPVFTDSLANITLPEDTPTDTLVATFNVSDSDSSSQISYSIQPNDTFSVNSSGSVFLISGLNFESISFYNLTVEASDATNNPVFATLIVFVTDVNEFPPSFLQNYTASVSENQPQGTTVITVEASDSDAGQQLLYTISGSRASEFQIDPNSGVVATLVSLDREDSRGSVISLQLQVTDSGNPTLVGFATLTLSVSDENDNNPQFVDIPSALTLPENTPVLTNITRIFATDADTGVNAEISYSIQDSGPFSITQTGEIQLANSLDFESEREYRLVVIATDGGANPRSTNATIEITVTDVNDNTPTFLNAPYKISVAEHSALYTVVFTALATDLDSGINSQLVFSLSTNPYFSIHQNTSVIVVAGVIDRELVDTINVTITVCDRGVPNLCASELLCVTVTDINDQNPMFDTQQSTLVLSEGPARTDFVFEAIATDNDDSTTDNSRIVSYSISPASSNFMINSQGQVFAPELDFETTERHQLEITATDGGNPPLYGYLSFIVTVTDVNDNAPILLIIPEVIELPEDLGESVLNVTITASDRDSGANGEVTFLLQELDTPFTLSSFGVLSLSGMFDFDAGPQVYTLNIVASDNGVPSMNSSGTLVVRVEDVNDNSPVFTQSSYETSIWEGQMPVFPVLEVSASDADFNSQISYSLSDNSTFSIDSTGIINGIAEIDFEETPQFEFNVIATDSGTPQRSVQALVTINIIDINDNAPQIVGGNGEINLSESADHPQRILALLALDSDSGQNGEVFFTLDSSSLVFSLDGNTGELFLNMSLDFETVQSYTFYITAHDRGDPELNSTIAIVVNVTNENDNAPIFSPAEYQVSVREDQQPNSFVTHVVAQDLDLSVLGMIDYTLSDNAFFSIDEQGSIYLVNSVNAESVTSLELFATACDRGTPPRCDTAPVSVSIIDVNDNSPLITSPTNGDIILIPESTAFGATISVIFATDSDESAPNNLVSFAITTASNDGLDIFAIDNITREIYLTNSLDFENPLMRLFNLTITASDLGFPSLNTTVSFQIQVTDVNDNSPVFTDGPLTVSVDENLPAQVGPQFNATDADTGINARIIFSISDSGSGLVSINQDTGLVTLNGPFDFEDINIYNFTVTATDQGSPSNSTTTSLIVHILDTNDNPPSFIMDLYTENIPESTAVNQNILIVSAVDNDGTTNNNVVSYSISPSDQTNFVINSNGGISLTQMLDFETLVSQTIQFYVIATDNGDPARSSLAIVMITVTDSNDNSPQIQPIPDAYILEGSANQTVLTTVQASDADSGLNAVLNYSIINSDPVPFSIGNTGNIFVAGVIDRETQDSYVLIVLIQDNGSPSLSTQVTVNVSVLDRNDNLPMFLSLPYTFHVPENVTIDTTVGSIEVTDRDIGINANLTCFLSGIGSDKFNLLPNGVIVTIALLDRENVSSYQLMVTCQDTSTSPLISTVSLSIIVTDINDNSPQFPSQQYVFDIREDANPNTNVGQLQASDLDDPTTPNAQIEFSILTGNEGNYFSITPDGLLLTNNTNGRIPVGNFTLAVAATDGGIPPLSSITNVLIRVIDVNDVAPSFNTSAIQPIRISEYTPVGENIANFTAIDLEGSEITYSLTTESGTPGDFRVDPMTGEVFVNRSLDFERDSVYTIEITAVDSPATGQGPPQTGIVTIVIFIIDQNDNSPVFDPETYQVNISENLLGPLTLVTVSATDGDSEANGIISYSLSLPTALAGLFSINSLTGVVSLASGVSFDFEGSLDNQFDITVIATDSGTPSRQSMALLTISITDVNDNSPQIPTAYTAVIIEGAQVMTFLIRVQATDLDTGLNGEIVYSLVSGESVPFEINQLTGDIFSTLVLDRETISSYSLMVSASDGGDPSLSNSTNVTVIVQDVNDNCPIIASGNTGQSIIEGTSGEVLNNNFQVSDLDTGLNGEFNYSIADPALQQIFRINSATGQLSLLQTLDREAVPRYNITVLITDGGLPACTATTFIIINVLDENDNRPIFIDTPYVVNISEGVPLNTPVICVNATDADVGVNAQFILELAGTNPFTLNPTTGCISTDGELDRETNPQFSLTVSATETSTSELPSTATVLVNLLDLNDVTPQFTMDPYTFTIIDLEIATTTVIGVLFANDEDEGLNGQLTYAHSLSETSLVEQTYAFSVSDMGMPSLSSGTDVIISFPSCENLEISTTNSNNEVNIFIRTFCSVSVELVSTFTVINSSVTLDCIVVTNLPFTVEWFRDGDPLQGPSSQTRLTIESLTEAEEGDYTCEASTSDHVLTSEPYSLIVQIPPIITIPPRNLAINDGDTLNLTCYSIGVPDTEHQWSLISNTLENGFVVLPSEDAPGFNVTKNQITLPDINAEYQGSYSCNASNVVGYDVASGEIIIHVPTDIVTIGLPTNFSNPDPNNNGCNNLLTPQLEDILAELTGTLSTVTSASGDSNLCDPSGGTTTTTTTTGSMCAPNPCNGYACTDDPTSLSGFFCECPPTLDGTTCELDVDECSQAVFCQNGATCINAFNGFTCNCVSGYTGEICEILISCTETSCPDGQMCMDTVDGSDCLVTQNVTVNTTNEQSAENVAGTAGNEGMNSLNRRRRRQTGAPSEPAYRNCTILPFREPGSTVVTLVIGCLEGFTLQESDFSEVCQNLYDSYANFRTCSTPTGSVLTGPKTPPTSGVIVSVILRDPTSREVIPGSTAVILINDRLNDANDTLVRLLIDLGFPEPDVTQISVTSPPVPVIPADFTAVIVTILLVLLIVVLIVFCFVLLCVCLRRRSKEDKVTSYEQSVHQQPVSKPADLEQALSVEMHDVSTEQPESDYGIIEQAVAVTTTFSNANAVESEEPAPVPAKQSLASKFSFKKDNVVKEEKASLVPEGTTETTEASNLASCSTDTSKKPVLGKTDSLPKRFLAATTSFGKKKAHSGIDATPLIDENTGSNESLSNPVPEALPEKLPPKKKSIEPQSPTINERELVAGALVPVTERDREYKEDEQDMYYNVEVKADATMAQLWETAIKDEKQEKKMLAGKKLITVQSQEDIQSGASNTVQATAPTDKHTEPIVKPTESTNKPTESTDKPTEPTDKPIEPIVKQTDHVVAEAQSIPQKTSPAKKPLTEKVEQTLSYPWYHSNLDREGAEIKLMQMSKEGAFLVRAASSSKGDYSLSVLVSYKEPLIKHLLIKDNGSQLVLQSVGARDTFPHLAALVAYYSKEVFEFPDWQKTVNLLYPVLIQ